MFHTADLSKYTFLVTGGAGFIGSHLVEYLLKHQAKKVRVLDNLSTGFFKNIYSLGKLSSFEFQQGDISDVETCKEACKGIDFVLHQAALGSVPRSFENPRATHDSNLTGFLNMLLACKEQQVKRMIYASSSSVYGDEKTLPKKEYNTGNPLSPYAVTKVVNEMYADVFSKNENLELIGLRYFNIFGARQNPKGAYAAVIPKFIQSLQNNQTPSIYGDGEQTRDFTFVENAVQANIKALFTSKEATGKNYNIALGERISLNQLWQTLKELSQKDIEVTYAEARKGDISDSLADISLAEKYLNYKAQVFVKEGLEITWKWFEQNNTYFDSVK